MLPGRSRPEEDAFVSSLAQASDVDALQDAITEAMEQRRPQLAARLVGLLPLDHDGGPEVERARSAASWLLVSQGTEFERAYSELEDAWSALRKHRMKRIKQRMRKALAGRTDRIERLDKRRR